jgi:hypothetical protein
VASVNSYVDALEAKLRDLGVKEEEIDALQEAATDPGVHFAPPKHTKHDLCVLGRAGLGDRHFLFSHLSSIVNQTSSTLFIPKRPCDSWNYALHGTGQTDCDRPWSAYFDLPPTIKPLGMCPQGSTPLNNKEAFKMVYSVEAKSPAVVKPLSLTCAEYKSIIPDKKDYTMYHVRRGDLVSGVLGEKTTALFRYATSVENVTAYYKWQNYKNPGSLLIYSTDEQDPKYVTALQTSLAKITPQVTRADDAFSSCKDNFCIFCNIMQLKRNAAFTYKFGWDGGAKKIRGGDAKILAAVNLLGL